MNTKFLFGFGLMILFLSTCSFDASPADSGIEGQVLIGPMCAVVQVGQECPNQPYQATLTVNSLNGSKIVQVQSDTQGRFRIPLAPGDYILHPESPNGIPSANEQSFRVEAGKFTQMLVSYDSGIR